MRACFRRLDSRLRGNDSVKVTNISTPTSFQAQRSEDPESTCSYHADLDSRLRGCVKSRNKR